MIENSQNKPVLNRMKSVMIITGEASGDQHGAHLISELKKKDNSLYIFGIGGNNLKAQGVDIIFDSSLLSVVGLVEVLSKLPIILKGMRVAKTQLEKKMPELLILVDFPDFNLNIAKKAKKLNIKVLYYISPQIWAWRTGRVKTIKKLVNHMAVILPFEEKFYLEHSVPATYVGHPLLDVKERVVNKPEDNGFTVIGLLPGSRNSEISKTLSVLLEAAIILNKKMKHLKFIIPLAKSVDYDLFEKITTPFRNRIDFQVEENGVENVFKKSTLVIATSGTVTMEAAIANVPMIIIYILAPITSIIGKMLIHVKAIGLPNLIAGKKIIPELIQNDANPEKISQTVFQILTTPKILIKMKKELQKVEGILGSKGASEKTAQIAIDLLK